jgi:ferrochelatase
MSGETTKAPNKAIILVNLGTPSAPETGAVRAFLKQFLSDRRVVELPRLLWIPILYGIILPFRSPRVARLYKQIWQEDSPLRLHAKKQVDLLAKKLMEKYGSGSPSVHLAMSYGQPGLSSVLSSLSEEGVEQLVVLPLYPQFSATTTASVYDQVAAFVKTTRNLPGITLVKDYHQHPDYIAALAASVRDYWRENGHAKKLLMSFHGIPQANVEKGDPYYDQCKTTASLLAAELGLSEQQWAISFQSRLGRAQWLQPYTSELLQEWGENAEEDIDVLCPAFSSDCLETLEEIAVENKNIFLNAGGKNYRYIPCLNDRDDHVSLLANLVSDCL